MELNLVKITSFGFVYVSVPCSFENGFCGLTQDFLSQNKWVTGQGSTPTLDTGPEYDHTTMSTDGKLKFQYEYCVGNYSIYPRTSKNVQ